jgi:hypothetical protein
MVIVFYILLLPSNVQVIRNVLVYPTTIVLRVVVQFF